MLRSTVFAFAALIFGTLTVHSEEIQPDKPLLPGESIRYSRLGLDDDAARRWCPNVCTGHYSGVWIKIPGTGADGDACICGKARR
jgi:hypothetical protein